MTALAHPDDAGLAVLIARLHALRDQTAQVAQQFETVEGYDSVARKMVVAEWWGKVKGIDLAIEALNR